MDQTVIRETISVTAAHVTDEDKALGAEFNKTMWRALAVANRYLSHGPESARLAIVKSFLSAASRLSALDSQSEVETARLAYTRMFSGISESIDAETKALTERTYDQDD